VKVRYTLPALADLDDILDYLAPRSSQGAARFNPASNPLSTFADAPFDWNAHGRSDHPPLGRHSLLVCSLRL